ncbi:hypothetical protein VP01_2892g3 [Puccinia sorghi]|uniref:Uncharacterized protein n=1 Tax=Puccinia sorghi TaxID=27349 RepID=A0A0L6V3F6_9BASI|nr:hypothetical protein VP01_2892g3 [Puccinia sorghi]
MSPGPIHPNHVFPALSRRTKRCASLDERRFSERLRPNRKRSTAILSFSFHPGRAIEWGSGNTILSKKQELNEDTTNHKENRRSFCTRFYKKFKAVTCCSTSSKLSLHEPETSRNKNQSYSSYVPIKSSGHLSIERTKTRRPLVTGFDEGPTVCNAECCVHCDQKCEQTGPVYLPNVCPYSSRIIFPMKRYITARVFAHFLSVSASLKDHPFHGLGTPTAKKQTWDQLTSPLPGRNHSPSPPPIPWHTRPKPTRPFRPSGEYDEEIVELNVSNRLPPPPCSPINDKPRLSVSNQGVAEIHSTPWLQMTLNAQDSRKSNGHTIHGLSSTFSEPTTSPSLSSSQKHGNIVGGDDYSLPTGESYIFSSTFNRQNLWEFSSTKKTKMMSFPGLTATHPSHNRRKQEQLPTRHTKSWNPSP